MKLRGCESQTPPAALGQVKHEFTAQNEARFFSEATGIPLSFPPRPFMYFMIQATVQKNPVVFD